MAGDAKAELANCAVQVRARQMLLPFVKDRERFLHQVVRALEVAIAFSRLDQLCHVVRPHAADL